MTTAAASINQTQCLVRQVRYCPASVVCNRCQAEAGYYSTAGRTAIDLDLARPMLLQITVSVHYCDRCRHYMRAQPPFLRPDGIYANVDQLLASPIGRELGAVRGFLVEWFQL